MNRKKNTIRTILFILGLLALLALISLRQYLRNDLSYITASQDSSEHSLISSHDTAKEQSLQITMLDVGQGLCLIIQDHEEYLIYDGGGRAYSRRVISYLEEHDIHHIRYMIASHYDEDHIAGLVAVLYNAQVDQILTADSKTDTEIYRSFRKALEKNGGEEIHPQTGDTFYLNDVEIQVLGPDHYDEKGENNQSIAIRITSGDFHALFTGDAEYEEEQQMISTGYPLQSDLYVAGHHGSNTSSSESFLDELSPKYVWISVGEDNTYGHPAAPVMKRLRNKGMLMYRTDKSGDVSLNWDGEKLIFSKKPCEDWTSPWEQMDEKDSQEKGQTKEERYVLNTRTLKFHLPTCTSVDAISEKNRQEIISTKEELMEEGYCPCGNCLKYIR